jgi:hypothetical protein
LSFEILAPESVRSKPAARDVVIDPELVLRESTGPAGGGLKPFG